MYDFDKVINRRNTNSVKWNVGENELPMWVADMDFSAPSAAIEAIQNKISVGALGYSIVPDEWYNAYISWWQRRHNFTIQKEWLHFTNGVIPAISSIIRNLTNPADSILIQPPVYNHFFNAIENNGRNILESSLVYENGTYSIDWKLLEQGLSDPKVSMMIVCNPQNPSGHIWSREELQHIGALCQKYGIIVIADEIHCDLTDPGVDYIPFASASEICRDISITCVAPSKTFNIPGVFSASVIVPNKNLRKKVWQGLTTDEIGEPNIIAIEATVTAFNHGEEWLDELRSYIYANKKQVKEFMQNELPEVKVVSSEATYLLWLDCSGFLRDGDDSKYLADFIREKTGLFVSCGTIYGLDGNKFLRFNIGCPRTTLLDGLKRLRDGVHSYLEIATCDTKKDI